MIALAGSVLLASLLGSPHCAGMCGGFVCFYAGSGGTSRRASHVAYNAGRLITYLVLGVLSGALGAGVEQMGATVGIARAAALVAGALMVGWGTLGLVHALGGRLGGGKSNRRGLNAPSAHPSFLRKPIALALSSVQGHSPPVRALVVGLVTTLLPCGWLYAFVAIAAGTGSPAAGALVMAAFWFGTLPMMAGLGIAAQGTFGALRRKLPVVTATLLIVLGGLTLAGKMHPWRVHTASGNASPARFGDPAAGAASEETPRACH